MKFRQQSGLPITRLAIEALEDRCVPATLAVSDVTVVEGKSGVQYAEVHVTLSEPLKRPVTVSYATSNNTATAGSDYAAVSGKLSFAKGQTDKTILIPVYGDQRPEYDESFLVRLSGNKGANMGDDSGFVTILDNSPRLAVTSEFAEEGGVMTFTVTLSTALSAEFTVDFTTLDGSTDVDVPDAAYAGQDYVAASGTLTFAPGETTKTFTVPILADDVEEFDEYFWIQLSNPSSTVLITGDGFGYIYGEYGQWW